MRIAIIGGIGCGKSQVTSVFKKFGYDIISADQVNREMLQDKDYLVKVKEKFPEAFTSGSFDKKILSDIVFTNDSRREELNKLAHPEILKRMFEFKSNKVVMELPLYIESGCNEKFDKIILVHTNIFKRLQRLRGRGLKVSTALKIMSTQVREKELRKVATDVINNNGTIEQLTSEIESYINKLNK